MDMHTPLLIRVSGHAGKQAFGYNLPFSTFRSSVFVGTSVHIA
jgi:hypothetical protein